MYFLLDATLYQHELFYPRESACFPWRSFSRISSKPPFSSRNTVQIRTPRQVRMISTFRASKRSVQKWVIVTCIFLSSAVAIRNWRYFRYLHQSAPIEEINTHVLSHVTDRVWAKQYAKFQRTIKAQGELIRSTDLNSVPLRRAYDIIEPVLHCPDEERFGVNEFNIGDGPKFVCGADALKHSAECIVYSIGSNWKFEFEEAVINTSSKCIIHTFDGTMDLTGRPLPATLHPNIHFHNFNVISDCEKESAQKYPSRCFRNIVHDLGHSKRTITWFKIDCEGCEFFVLPHALEFVNVHQLIVEVHGTNASNIVGLFQHLSKCGLFVFHKERNHWGCDGYRCVEFSLISLDYAQSIHREMMRALH